MRHWPHIQHKRSTFISEISVRAGSRPISLLCGIHHTIKITLVQSVPPAMCFASAYSVPRERKKKKKKTFCRSSFSLAAGEQIKATWRRNTFSPPSHSLSLPLVCSRQLVLSPKKSSWKWCPFQVVQLVEGIYHSSGLHGKDFLLHFTPSIHFCSCSPPLWFHWDGKSSE